MTFCFAYPQVIQCVRTISYERWVSAGCGIVYVALWTSATGAAPSLHYCVQAVLDGFTLLDACKVEDPEDGIEAILNDANLCKVIPEDLAFFTKLEFLDLGENQIQFAHLSALTALQVLCKTQQS